MPISPQSSPSSPDAASSPSSSPESPVSSPESPALKSTRLSRLEACQYHSCFTAQERDNLLQSISTTLSESKVDRNHWYLIETTSTWCDQFLSVMESRDARSEPSADGFQDCPHLEPVSWSIFLPYLHRIQIKHLTTEWFGVSFHGAHGQLLLAMSTVEWCSLKWNGSNPLELTLTFGPAYELILSVDHTGESVAVSSCSLRDWMKQIHPCVSVYKLRACSSE